MGKGGGDKSTNVSEQELARRRQVAKITPLNSIDSSAFLKQYDTDYKDTSSSEEEAESKKAQDSDDEESGSGDGDDGLTRNEEAKATNSDELTSEQEDEEEAREVDELMEMARSLEGEAVIDVRYDSMIETRAKKAEKRRLDSIEVNETCWQKFCRVLCCRPRVGTIPSLKLQKRFLKDVKNELIPEVRHCFDN